jgi:hypothetical protein
MKPILHLQIPINDSGKMLIDIKTVQLFVKVVEQKLHNNFDVIATPFVPSILDEDLCVVNFTPEQISDVNEFMNDLLKKE